MSLPLQIASAALRAAVVADVRAAWNLTAAQVWTDAPETPAAAADLPRAYVTLPNVAFGGATAGATGYAGVYEYAITYQAMKPASGSLQAVKEGKANALLARLTASPDYAGGVWIENRIRVNLSPDPAEASDGAYSVTVTFAVDMEG